MKIITWVKVGGKLMGIIREEQILELIEDISVQAEELQANVESFQEQAERIQVVLDALGLYYRTTGGSVMLKKISDIEFDSGGLQTISQDLGQITCEYDKKEVPISTRVIH